MTTATHPCYHKHLGTEDKSAESAHHHDSWGGYVPCAGDNCGHCGGDARAAKLYARQGRA